MTERAALRPASVLSFGGGEFAWAAFWRRKRACAERSVAAAAAAAALSTAATGSPRRERAHKRPHERLQQPRRDKEHERCFEAERAKESQRVSMSILIRS